MKRYEIPELEVVKFASSDVLANSQTWTDGSNASGDGEFDSTDAPGDWANP